MGNKQVVEILGGTESTANRVIEENKPITTKSENIEELQVEIINKNTREIIDEFNKYLINETDIKKLKLLLGEIKNKINIKEQPSCEEIVDILVNVLGVQSHHSLEVGQKMSAEKIEELFGRSPYQEGINFCNSTKELFIITKIGSNNLTIDSAQYNDYWKQGKIMYEGKGQKSQSTIGSNLHIVRKYQVFHNKIKCKKGIPDYIHVFNKINNNGIEKYMYLGIYDVTDYYVNEHSVARKEYGVNTKTALIFELTPRIYRDSDKIDSNYEF